MFIYDVFIVIKIVDCYIIGKNDVFNIDLWSFKVGEGIYYLNRYMYSVV